MPLPEPLNPPAPQLSPVPPQFLAELLALQPYVEHILCDGSRDSDARAAAKDRVQTVLRKVIQHLPSYEPHKEGLRPWVTRIAWNEKVDAYRSCQCFDDTFGHDHIAADFAPSSSPSPEREAQVRAFLEKVFVIIEEMPPDMQDVLVLSTFCEDSHAEIAAQLNISEDAAKMRLSRARRLLRKRAGSIRDHVGLWLLLLPRKLAASRVRTFRFLWQTAHLLPPVLISLGLSALPQFEPTRPMPTENLVVAPLRDESSLYVRDNRHAVDIAETNRFVQGPVQVITQQNPPSSKVHGSDKPRQSTPRRRTFEVVLPSDPILLNGRQ